MSTNMNAISPSPGLNIGSTTPAGIAGRGGAENDIMKAPDVTEQESLPMQRELGLSQDRYMNSEMQGGQRSTMQMGSRSILDNHPQVRSPETDASPFAAALKHRQLANAFEGITDRERAYRPAKAPTPVRVPADFAHANRQLIDAVAYEVRKQLGESPASDRQQNSQIRPFSPYTTTGTALFNGTAQFNNFMPQTVGPPEPPSIVSQGLQ